MLPLSHAFHLPEPAHAIEFRAFTHGLMPRTAERMMGHFVDDWRRFGVDAWNEVPNHWRPDSGDRVGWWSLPEYLGDTFIAPLLKAPPGTCILQPNVHWTVQCLLSDAGRPAAGEEVVVTEAAFPSVLHSVQQWAQLRGYRVRRVAPTAEGFVDRDALLAAVGPRTALVFLSHVGFTTGERVSDAFLVRLAETVHAAGGLLVVDGYHATASLPVDVTALGMDVYLGGLLKEACGSSGNAFVYLRPGLDVQPRISGWFGEADPFAFSLAPTPHPTVRRRFLGGTTAVAPMYHAVEGLRLLLNVGLEAVRAYSLDLTDACLARADDAGLALRSPREADRRSAMVVLDVPEAERVSAALKAAHVYVDSRQGRYLRLAPFVWNTREEVDRAFDLLVRTLRNETDQKGSSASRSSVGPVT